MSKKRKLNSKNPKYWDKSQLKEQKVKEKRLINTVKGCKIWVAQGGTNNTGHNYCLMRYDIDVDGDLSNGVVVASTSTINSDDHSHARAATLSLSGTAANLDVDFSSNQILIALIEPTIAYNSYMAAKVILEYTEVMT